MQARSTDAAEFGWMLQGRAIAQLDDRTRRIDLTPTSSPVPCYQCGVCTTSCALAQENLAFPRRTIALILGGHETQASRQPEVWECHACGDCTERCPNMLKPGSVLASLRRKAVRETAAPTAVFDALDTGWGLGGAFTLAIGVVVVVAGTTGSLLPEGPVHYASFMPHAAIGVVFGVLTLVGALSMIVAVRRSWQRFGSAGRLGLVEGWHWTTAVAAEALSHRRHAACPTGKGSALAHAAVFFGFLGLTVIAAWAAGTVALGGQYPFPLSHPMKIVSNVLALGMVVGSVHALVRRFDAYRRGELSSVFDWALPSGLLLVSVTGVALELLRVLDVRAAAYPVYVVHLATVALLLGLWPWTKLAHGAHRLVALIWLRHSSRRPPRPSPHGKARHHEPAHAWLHLQPQTEGRP